jgi:hypothetical protein
MPKTNSVSVRPEERLCGEALEWHLKEQYGISSSWSGVQPDPPDLRFDLTRTDGKTESWGVEVTGLVQYIEWNGDEVNRRVFEPAIFKMVKRLNEELGPSMTYGYFLNITGPLDAAVFRDLDRRVREYITSGKTEEEALDYPEALASVEKEIPAKRDDPVIREVMKQVTQGRIKVTIKASPGCSGVVVFSGIGGAARIPGTHELAANVDATLKYATKRILDAKLPRMAKVNGYDRKVLLVWCNIPFADASDVAGAFKAQELAGIDGIFFAEFGSDRVTLIADSGLGIEPK